MKDCMSTGCAGGAKPNSHAIRRRSRCMTNTRDASSPPLFQVAGVSRLKVEPVWINFDGIMKVTNREGSDPSIPHAIGIIVRQLLIKRVVQTSRIVASITEMARPCLPPSLTATICRRRRDCLHARVSRSLLFLPACSPRLRPLRPRGSPAPPW